MAFKNLEKRKRVKEKKGIEGGGREGMTDWREIKEAEFGVGNDGWEGKEK